MEIEEHIKYGKKLCGCLRDDLEDGEDNKVLDGIEGHFESIGQDLKREPGHRWLVVADDDSGVQGIANVSIVIAETEDEAIETADENSVTFGTLKAYEIGETLDYGEIWSYYI